MIEKYVDMYVYYDDTYATNYIPDNVSLEITNFLREKGFCVLNADELAEMMEKCIDEDTCWKTLVVFSRDVVPETICHYDYPNVLMREYLDRGGTIIWIGDVPLYWRGLRLSPSDQLKLSRDEKGRKEELVEDEKGRLMKIYLRQPLRASFNILEVISLLTKHPGPKVNITKAGRKLGLSSSWYSDRPILLRGLRKRGLKVLATSKPRYIMPFEKAILDEKKERRFISSLDVLSRILGVFPSLVAVATASYLYLAGFASTLIWLFLGLAVILFTVYFTYWFICLKETYAGAWFKNFDKRHPYSGFYRLWDYKLYRINQNMLNDLLNVILNIVCAKETVKDR